MQWSTQIQPPLVYYHHTYFPDFREMLMHSKAELPSTMHLPVSLDDILHFYRYLHTHILVAEELLFDVPIQDCALQLKIYEVFNLFIPRGNLST